MRQLTRLVPHLVPVLFLLTLLLFFYGYWQGYELSIGWNVTTSAESEGFTAHSFRKGPFQFSLNGDKYSLVETFSAGPIERSYGRDGWLLALLFLGISILLAVVTYLPRLWFIGVIGLFIFFVMSMSLPEVGLFGFSSRTSLGVLIAVAAWVLPGYALHAFYDQVSVWGRIGIFILVTGLLVIFSGVDVVQLQEQVIVGSYYGLVILCLLFLLLIAEENVFAILYLVTRTKGGRNNHLHFSFFTLAYLTLLWLYYVKKAGILRIEITYFDPYILLGVSALVALWALQYKKYLFEHYLTLTQARMLFSTIGVVVFAFLSLGFFRGNDPVNEGLHYFIVYAHLGFGAFFFFYLLLNFINPMAKGLVVYKVAYHEQNMPYVSARIAGMVAVAAFFFLAEKQPFHLLKAGYYNYLGAQAETNGNKPLALGFYRESSVYGFDNHFANYSMGYHELQKGDTKEANYRFWRSTLRFPSPHSFVNHAGTHAMLGQATPSLVALQAGNVEFPASIQIKNNLALTYTDLGKYQQAEALFGQTGTGQWTQASRVNYWKVVQLPTEEMVRADFEEGNLAVKTNVISKLLERGAKLTLPFDTIQLYPSYPLHRLAFLINSCWYFADERVNHQLKKALTGPVDENMYRAALHSLALNYYLVGNVNEALRSMERLQFESPTIDQGLYLNEMGLIALDQHAVKLALEYFEQAIAKGHASALVNKTACLLELGLQEEAEAWVQQLAREDSTFQQLANDVLALEADSENIDQQLTRIYYRYAQYEPSEIAPLLAQADTIYLNSLWRKMASEQLKMGEYAILVNYQNTLKPLLRNEETFAEADFLMAFAKGQKIINSYPLAQIMQLEDAGERSSALAELASKNALNEPLFLTCLEELRSLDLQAAYDLSVAALDLNQASVALRKAYVLTAVEMGLDDYAESARLKLQDYTDEATYQAFYQEYLEAKARVEATSVW